MTTARPAPAGFWTEWRLWTTKMTPRMSPAHWCYIFNGPLNGESKFALCWVILDTNSETQRVHKKSPSYIADRASACVLEHHCVVWSGKYFKQIFWHGKVMYPAIYILGTSFLANGGWLSMRMTDSLPESLFLWMRRSWRREMMMMMKMTLKLLLVWNRKVRATLLRTKKELSDRCQISSFFWVFLRNITQRLLNVVTSSCSHVNNIHSEDKNWWQEVRRNRR